MSKYLTFTDIVFKNEALLVAALASLGYAEVERGEALPLYGYMGDERAERARGPLGGLRQDLAEHIRQDPAVFQVLDFDRCVGAQRDCNFFRAAILAPDRERHVLPRTEFAFHAAQVEGFGSLDLE